MHRLPRRAWLQRAAWSAAAAALAGCGFELRRSVTLPFASVALVGFGPGSTLAAELARQLAHGAAVVPLPTAAAVVLEALVERRERSVVASTAAGQVREVQLRVRLEFRLSTRRGVPLLAPDEIVRSRDMSFSETLVLAKAEEEERLYRAMDADIADQVMRRLAMVRLA